MGPEHASASVLDGIVWVLSPPTLRSSAVATLESWVEVWGRGRCACPPTGTIGWWRSSATFRRWRRR